MRFGLIIRVLGLAGMVASFANLPSAKAQGLPEAAVLPADKGAWAVDQLFKTNIMAAGFESGYVRIIVLSNGKVFHRKMSSTLMPLTPWCQDQLTAEEMRAMRSAVAGARPSAWQGRYGEWINIYAPFRKLTLTVREANGQAVNYVTMVYREYAMTDEIAMLAKATDGAGNLAFYHCYQSREERTEKREEKVENGATLYAVTPEGDLLWFRHTGFQNGTQVWGNNDAAKKVGYEWAGNLKVFKGDPRGKDGVVYKINSQGALTWFKHQGVASGSLEWETSKNINLNFDGRQVFAAGGGILYRLDNSGDLYWYKHLGYQTGEKLWANNGKGIKVNDATNTKWPEAQQVFAGGDGVIYLIDRSGTLYWQKHLGYTDGTPRWSELKKIATGWNNLQHIFCAGDGIIYALNNDGVLLWQKHEGVASGAALWAKGGAASKVASGWHFKFVF